MPFAVEVMWTHGAGGSKHVREPVTNVDDAFAAVGVKRTAPKRTTPAIQAPSLAVFSGCLIMLFKLVQLQDLGNRFLS